MTNILDFFHTYSVPDIIIILVFLASAIMGAGKFVEGTVKRLRIIFGKEYQDKNKETALEERLVAIENKSTRTQAEVEGLKNSMDFFSDKLEILVDSDKDSIKAYLTDKHHYYCYEKKWIDDYNLDCIERRYVHYKKAGGNSFVDHLMDELRMLPTQPPEEQKK